MTPKEIVLSGYEAFAEGNMAKLGAIYHPECRININGKHALSGEYLGFDAFASEVLAKLETTWPGFNLDITKVVAEGVDVCIFLKVTANNLDSCSIHHFIVEDGLETEFNIYDDSQRMAEAMMTIWMIAKKSLHARPRAEFLCQFCATSLQNPAILRNIP